MNTVPSDLVGNFDPSTFPTREKQAPIASPGHVLLGCMALGTAMDATAGIEKELSLSGDFAAAIQCERVSGPPDEGDTCDGAAPLHLEIGYRPNKHNEFFLHLGFAVGNDLNESSPWTLAPWGTDLRDDFRDIDGRGRNHLLNAWYRHLFDLGDGEEIDLWLGVIDSTDFLDANQYANDEFNQFMNEAMINAWVYGLPSYDSGAALEWRKGDWSATTVAMNIGQEDGGGYDFLGAELAYHSSAAAGRSGHYRLVLVGTSHQAIDDSGDDGEGRLAWGLSFDQELGELLGVFGRAAWQAEDAAVTYRAQYSGGFDLQGRAWNQPGDNIGVGFAYLEGGNLDLKSTQLFEAYYRHALDYGFAVTADLQYMADRFDDADRVSGWIAGVRVAVEF